MKTFNRNSTYNKRREERRKLSRAATQFARENGIGPRPEEGLRWPKGRTRDERMGTRKSFVKVKEEGA